MRARLATREAEIVVGTHALIQEGVAFARSPWRSWTSSTASGSSSAGARRKTTPHVLHMTATPIPRTLALTVYGDLDVTEITTPPAGRKPVVTRWVSHERSAEAYTRLRRHLRRRPAGVRRLPARLRIGEHRGEGGRGGGRTAARRRAQDFRVGCLHGRLRPRERRDVMDAFKRRELDVLVATTVIEVGVDVPNATIMIVQEADRFGLAQLHQLRGRVGRGAEQSYCLLVSRPKDELTDDAASASRRSSRRRTDSSSPRSTSSCAGRAVPRHAPVRPQRPQVRAAPTRPSRADRRVARAGRTSWPTRTTTSSSPLAVRRSDSDEDHRGFA